VGSRKSAEPRVGAPGAEGVVGVGWARARDGDWRAGCGGTFMLVGDL